MRQRPLPHLTIQQLDYLVAVADHDTWADAAATLGVTPSALSQGLAELERRLGLELFERVGRRRIIAARSKPVVDYARRVLADTGDIGRWIERTNSGLAGALRVGMIDAAAIGHYPEVLRRFRTDHPGVDFTLRVAPSGDLLHLVLAGEIDLAVVVKPPEMPVGIDWTDALEEPLAVYGPPGVDIGPPSTWGPWVSFSAASHTRRLIAEAVTAVGATFDVVAESNQPDVLREMVRLGMGWTVLPVIQAESEPNPLQRARTEPLTTRTVAVATRSGSIENPVASALLSSIGESARRSQPATDSPSASASVTN